MDGMSQVKSLYESLGPRFQLKSYLGMDLDLDADLQSCGSGGHYGRATALLQDEAKSEARRQLVYELA